MKKRLKKKLEKRDKERWRNILKRIKENIEKCITNNMIDEQYLRWVKGEVIYRRIIDITIDKEENKK